MWVFDSERPHVSSTYEQQPVETVQSMKKLVNKKQSSFYFFTVLFFCILYTFMFFPLHIYVSYFTYTDKNVFLWLRVCETIVGVVLVVGLWVLLYCLPTTSLVEILKPTITISSTIFFTLTLIRRTFVGSCSDYIVRDVGSFYILVEDWSCNPYGIPHTFPLDTTIVLMCLPVLHILIFKEKRWNYAVFTWIITLIGFITCSVRLSAYRTIPVIILYAIVSWMMMKEAIFYQEVAAFVEEKGLRKSGLVVDEEEVDEEEAVIVDDIERGLNISQRSFLQQTPVVSLSKKALYEKEMRNMVANVAHDLKTVRLTSFFFLPCVTLSCLLFSLSLSRFSCSLYLPL
jgi:hypothetical protein